MADVTDISSVRNRVRQFIGPDGVLRCNTWAYSNDPPARTTVRFGRAGLEIGKQGTRCALFPDNYHHPFGVERR